MSIPAYAMLASFLCNAETPPELAQKLRRVGEEAEVFAMLAPRIIGEEKLDQVALVNQVRFQTRGKPAPPDKFRTRQIVSEYGFTTLKQDLGNLHEIRQVQTVDGKRVKPPGKLRETLAMGHRADTERLKKNMLKEFQSHGLREVAIDFGQIILTFLPRQQEFFEFRVVRTEFLGAERVEVIAYQQRLGIASMTVFEEGEVKRHILRGELTIRASDGFPLRVTVDTYRDENGIRLRHLARVDYERNEYGCILPIMTYYAESLAHQGAEKVFVENRFQYGNYKMFGASSEVKFTAEDPPATPAKK